MSSLLIFKPCRMPLSKGLCVCPSCLRYSRPGLFTAHLLISFRCLLKNISMRLSLTILLKIATSCQYGPHPLSKKTGSFQCHVIVIIILHKFSNCFLQTLNSRKTEIFVCFLHCWIPSSSYSVWSIVHAQ